MCVCVCASTCEYSTAGGLDTASPMMDEMDSRKRAKAR